jgi:hypothetical protein
MPGSSEGDPKRIYTPPRLTAHGTLRDITRQATSWPSGPGGRGPRILPIDPLTEGAMSPLTS